jgi:hypothetical protein
MYTQFLSVLRSVTGAAVPLRQVLKHKFIEARSGIANNLIRFQLLAAKSAQHFEGIATSRP